VQACSKNIYSSSLRSNHWRVEVAYQYPGAYKFQQQLHRIKRVYPLLVSQYRDAANTLLHHSLIIRMLLIRTLLMTPPAAQSRHVLSVTFAVPLEPGRFLLQLHHSFTESDGSATVSDIRSTCFLPFRVRQNDSAPPCAWVSKYQLASTSFTQHPRQPSGPLAQQVRTHHHITGNVYGQHRSTPIIHNFHFADGVRTFHLGAQLSMPATSSTSSIVGLPSDLSPATSPLRDIITTEAVSSSPSQLPCT
jgi:hypothetical protein